MNTFQLVCFLAVAENLSFARAAEQLHITQPAVTQQIRTLEKELGVTVCTISALRGEGVKEAAQKAVDIASSGVKTIPMHTFGGSVEHALAHIEEAAPLFLPCA